MIIWITRRRRTYAFLQNFFRDLGEARDENKREWEVGQVMNVGPTNQENATSLERSFSGAHESATLYKLGSSVVSLSYTPERNRLSCASRSAPVSRVLSPPLHLGNFPVSILLVSSCLISLILHAAGLWPVPRVSDLNFWGSSRLHWLNQFWISFVSDEGLSDKISSLDPSGI